MIISFGWTAQYLPPNGTKTCTRQVWTPKTFSTWESAFKSDYRHHIAVDKKISYGGKRIGTIFLTDRPYLQRLSEMPESDLIAEGGMAATLDEFIAKYFGGDKNTEVAVLRFEFDPRELLVTDRNHKTIWAGLKPGDIIGWARNWCSSDVEVYANVYGVKLIMISPGSALVDSVT